MRKLLFLFIPVLLLPWNGSFADETAPVYATTGYIYDGDTFAAKVKLENNVMVSVRVRILGIDTPEIHGDCDSEIQVAIKARDKLGALLPENSIVQLSDIKDDKYLGRIDANVRLSDGRDVGAIMLKEKLARKYNGGKRKKWCD
ncbi:MAG: thermonuclease family protein [Alphaproteobacteria bacterium]